MRKFQVFIVLIALAVGSRAQAEHHNGLGGLILGAGGGALVGQAIGRDTQSTVIGTAVGSVIGYMIGNDMDRDAGHYQPVTHRHQQHPRPVVRKHVRQHRYNYEPVEYHQPPPQRIVQKHITQYNYYYEPTEYEAVPNRHCKKAEILGTVHGKARKLHGTVCRTPDGWELVSQEPEPAYSERKRSHWRKPWKHSKHRSRDYRQHRPHRQHWVEHRF